MNTLIELLKTYSPYVAFVLFWALNWLVAFSYGALARVASRQNKKVAEGIDGITQSERNYIKDQTGMVEPVSVVIVAHNQADALRRNLPLVLEQDYEDFEVVVVDNASTDETDDLLKDLENLYVNLRHTFAPLGARHISRKRLALTIGIKAARNEWLIITEPNSRPSTPGWIQGMAQQFGANTQIVLGYANYEPHRTYASKRAVFFNLFHQIGFLSWTAGHKKKAYRCNPANFAYRKSFFMQHKGFADDFNLINGAAELLVNRHSTAQNTSVAISPKTKVVCKPVEDTSSWRLKCISYMEIRRHFISTFAYRLYFNFKQIVVPFLYLSIAISLAWSIYRQEWWATIGISVLYLLLYITKIRMFNNSSRSVGEHCFYLSFLWYELNISWWHLCSIVMYRFVPRSRFYRKAF